MGVGMQAHVGKGKLPHREGLSFGGLTCFQRAMESRLR